MLLHISKPYLWFPVVKENPEVKLHLYLHQENSPHSEKIQEIDIHLGGNDRDFYTSMDVSLYLGQDMEICGEVEEDMLYGIFCCDSRVQNIYPFRPLLHFSPEIGWNNDPNGMVFAHGLYHLYYQWNPYGVVWGNMHWGHAVSRDLLTWEHRPLAMAPDEYGTAFSGCGWADQENTAGYGRDALLFYYTAAGGTNTWSAEKHRPFTQRLKVSTDGGETLKSSDKFFLDHVAGENRDPKVFYHQESQAYIMLLYLDGSEFAFYRSKDLLSWEESSRLSVKGMWECPDLFELPVENTGNTDHAENSGNTADLGQNKKWVFWSADGYYVVGNFDGWRFTPETPLQTAYSTKLPYAAQSFAGVSGRTISIAWLRTDNCRGNYRGLMSLPAELSLVTENSGWKLKFRPVRELENCCGPAAKLASDNAMAATKLSLKGTPLDIHLSWEPQKKGTTKLSLGNIEIIVDFVRETIRFNDLEKHADTAFISFCRQKPLHLRLIIDQEVIEFFGNHGIIYGAVEMEENILRRTLWIESTAKIASMEWREITPVSFPAKTEDF